MKRVIILVVTIMIIYLLFPILIVPSSLPAIQEASSGEVQIYQLSIDRVPTLKDRINYLKARHRQGIYLIFKQ